MSSPKSTSPKISSPIVLSPKTSSPKPTPPPDKSITEMALPEPSSLLVPDTSSLEDPSSLLETSDSLPKMPPLPQLSPTLPSSSLPFPNHILKSTSLTEIPSLRRLMIDLHFMLTATPLESTKGLPPLTEDQERIIATIIFAAQNDRLHTLLLQASLRFVAARNGTDEEVLKATQELAELANEETFTMPEKWTKEYQLACQVMDGWDEKAYTEKELEQLAPGIDKKYSASIQDRRVNPGFTALVKEEQKPVPPLDEEPRLGAGIQFENSPAHPATALTAKPNESAGGTPKNDETGKDESEYDSDIENQDPLRRSTRDRRPSIRHSKRPASQNGHPEPKRSKRPGSGRPLPGNTGARDEEKGPAIWVSSGDESEEPDADETNPAGLAEHEYLVYDPGALRVFDGQVIDDFTYSREAPQLNHPMEPLRNFAFNTELPHPVHKGYRILGEPKRINQLMAMDWNSTRDVKHLREWRNTALNKNMGKRLAKEIFLKSEAENLTKLVKAQLKKVGGRWSRIDWDTVKKDLDIICRNDGKKQLAGEPIEPVRFSFTLKDNLAARQHVLSCGRLASERHYPKRVDVKTQPSLDLGAIFETFIDDRKRRIWQDAKKADKRADERAGKRAPPPEARDTNTVEIIGRPPTRGHQLDTQQRHSGPGQLTSLDRPFSRGPFIYRDRDDSHPAPPPRRPHQSYGRENPPAPVPREQTGQRPVQHPGTEPVFRREDYRRREDRSISPQGYHGSFKPTLRRSRSPPSLPLSRDYDRGRVRSQLPPTRLVSGDWADEALRPTRHGPNGYERGRPENDPRPRSPPSRSVSRGNDSDQSPRVPFKSRLGSQNYDGRARRTPSLAELEQRAAELQREADEAKRLVEEMRRREGHGENDQ